MNRRAQGISVNVIIIAAIALVVMVLLITLVLNSAGDVNTGVSSCANIGDGVQGPNGDYMCVNPDDACPGGMTYMPQKACSGSTEGAPLKCCQALV